MKYRVTPARWVLLTCAFGCAGSAGDERTSTPAPGDPEPERRVASIRPGSGDATASDVHSTGATPAGPVRPARAVEGEPIGPGELAPEAPSPELLPVFLGEGIGPNAAPPDAGSRELFPVFVGPGLEPGGADAGTDP